MRSPFSSTRRSTLPFADVILTFSTVSSGLWSLVRGKVSSKLPWPTRPSSARASPAHATCSFIPCSTAATAVHPENSQSTSPWCSLVSTSRNAICSAAAALSSRPSAPSSAAGSRSFTNALTRWPLGPCPSSTASRQVPSCLGSATELKQLSWLVFLYPGSWPALERNAARAEYGASPPPTTRSLSYTLAFATACPTFSTAATRLGLRLDSRRWRVRAPLPPSPASPPLPSASGFFATSSLSGVSRRCLFFSFFSFFSFFVFLVLLSLR
mmetsp:Transcript_18885/g.36423  ORF Transcript_18885/g.36423 Transcript_18885/m.36423 type:complete len:269 (-) Transcript_18885:647-1453(-)